VGDVTETVYLLCGFVGSGKTTYARQLEAEGVARLSVDEIVFERHGRHGVDYPESEHPSHWDAAVEEVDRRLNDLLAAGKSVVLDFGFWSREDRDRYSNSPTTMGRRGGCSTSGRTQRCFVVALKPATGEPTGIRMRSRLRIATSASF
jgi:predicted kinase